MKDQRENGYVNSIFPFKKQPDKSQGEVRKPLPGHVGHATQGLRVFECQSQTLELYKKSRKPDHI